MSVESLLRDLVLAGKEAFVRLNDGLIDLRVGCQEKKPALIFITSFEPPPLPNFSSLSFLKGHRTDGRWTTLLRLEREELDAIFVQLATDLAATTFKFDEEHAAYTAFVERVRYWRELFASKRSEVLSDNLLRGFVGELLFLHRHGMPSRGAGASIAAWAGPLRGKKDFRYPDVHIEVKAAGTDAVQIASMEQLEDEGSMLTLAVVPILLRQAEGPDSMSVAKLVSLVREKCEGTSRALFEEKLTVYGYSDLPDYAVTHFDYGQFSFFAVGVEFPRLTRQTVPTGVVACEYALLLSALAPFAATGWEAAA